MPDKTFLITNGSFVSDSGIGRSCARKGPRSEATRGARAVVSLYNATYGLDHYTECGLNDSTGREGCLLLNRGSRTFWPLRYR